MIKILNENSTSDFLLNFLKSHILYNEPINPSVLDKLLLIYPECKFSGTLYRLLNIPEELISENVPNYEGLYHRSDILEFIMNDFYKESSDYKCCTKNEFCLKGLSTKLKSRASDFDFTISFNVSEGIDINKLIDIAEDLYPMSEVKDILLYKEDEEVISKIPKDIKISHLRDATRIEDSLVWVYLYEF